MSTRVFNVVIRDPLPLLPKTKHSTLNQYKHKYWIIVKIIVQYSINPNVNTSTRWRNKIMIFVFKLFKSNVINGIRNGRKMLSKIWLCERWQISGANLIFYFFIFLASTTNTNLDQYTPQNVWRELFVDFTGGAVWLMIQQAGYKTSIICMRTKEYLCVVT